MRYFRVKNKEVSISKKKKHFFLLYFSSLEKKTFTDYFLKLITVIVRLWDGFFS